MNYYYYQRPRKKKRFILWFLLVLLLAAGAAWLYVRSLLGAVDEPGAGQTVTLNIASGSGAADIGSQLYQNGLTQKSSIFYWYVLATGSSADLKSGTYNFSTEQSVAELVEELISGSTDQLSFTIPEGYTLQQITDLLVSKGLADQTKFTQLLSQGTFAYDFLPEPDRANWLEGYLFPDTYYIASYTQEEEIINLMLEQFGQIAEQLDWQGNYTLDQIVTIASMIEKEAGLEEERDDIASVIYNRLAINMKLDIDATLLYVLNKDTLTNADKSLDSPYNTYLHAGLPPTPIASPGKASLEAALNPASTDYYYYVLNPQTGGHVFAKTYAEHLQNVDAYLEN